MQSSTAIAFRALVMLVCLITIPLFAIFGRDLPQVIKGLLEGRGLVLGPAPGAPAQPPASSPANPFGTTAPYRAANDSLATPAGQRNLAGAPSGSNATPATPAAFPPPGSPAKTSSGGGPSTSDALVQSGPYGSTPSASGLIGGSGLSSPPAGGADWKTPPTPGGAQPANFQTPAAATPINPSEIPLRDPLAGGGSAVLQNVDPRASANALAGAPSPREDGASSVYGNAGGTRVGNVAPSGPAADAKFHAAELRLRELGATHYMLESWGPENNRYRFVCEVAVAGGAGMNRYFQKSDDDPWRAMEAVLHEVEDFRAGDKR